MVYATHKKPKVGWKHTDHMFRKTVFTWSGRPVNCEKLVDGKIVDQDIMQDAITDPVKGHLYDLKEGICLVKGLGVVSVFADVDVDFNLFGKADKVRKCVEKIVAALEEFWSEELGYGEKKH